MRAPPFTLCATSTSAEGLSLEYLSCARSARLLLARSASRATNTAWSSQTSLRKWARSTAGSCSPGSRLTYWKACNVCMRVSRFSGLNRQWSIPASLARRRSSCRALAVSPTTRQRGLARRRSCSRIARTKAKPPSLGMLQSLMTTSNVCCNQRRKA
ncbi:hypothetical protein D3C80_1587000 [compost metagenome]